MVNQSKVAKLAGVSFITVSRVINNKSNVKEKTRERVLEAIDKLGYYPNSLGRGLSSNKVHTLGMRLRGDISNNFTSDLLSGVESICKKFNYNLLLNFGNNDSELSPFFERKVDGLIFLFSNITDSDISLIEKKKIPCVILWDEIDSEDVISVRFNDVRGGCIATEHLIESGHKNIAYIGGDKGNKCAEDRFEGYLQAMANHNIKVKKKFLFSGDFSKESGKKIAHKIIKLKKLPTAIFCVGDEVAFGVMEVFRSEGIRIPDDVSIIGFDSGAATSHVYCPLTSIYNPVKEIGRVGTQLLLDRINGIKTPNIVNDFEVKLVLRKSTQKI